MLSYNEEHLPDINELKYEDFQKFMRRLRKKTGKKIRFFMCGEYGEKYDRPHYHACLFNHRFDDLVYFKTTPSGSKVYTSKELDNLWTDQNGNSRGFASVSDLDFDSASYIARYVTKKVMSRGQHTATDIETGEVMLKEKEFNKMSLKPGIGYDFYQKWKDDMFPADICIINGKPSKPPRYYYKKLKEEDGDMYDEIAYQRGTNALEHSKDNTEERLLVKEKILIDKIKKGKREIE